MSLEDISKIFDKRSSIITPKSPLVLISVGCLCFVKIGAENQNPPVIYMIIV